MLLLGTARWVMLMINSDYTFPDDVSILFILYLFTDVGFLQRINNMLSTLTYIRVKAGFWT